MDSTSESHLIVLKKKWHEVKEGPSGESLEEVVRAEGRGGLYVTKIH